MRSITDLIQTRGKRRRSWAGEPALSPPLAPLERSRIWQRLRSWPWLHPVLRAAWVLAVITGLAWMGARSARSASPAPQADATTATMLAALSTAAAAAEERSVLTAQRDAGAEAGAGDHAKRRRGVLDDGRIVLNEATEADLCKLPGIGPSRAAKILALRDRLQRFRSIRQLLRVRGIGPRTLRKLEPRIVLDAPPEPAEGGKRSVEEKR